MNAPAEREHVTLADLYGDDGLSDQQIRRMVSLLRLAEPRERSADQAA